MKLKLFLRIVVLLLITKISFGQIDSIQNRKIYSWTLNQYDLSLENVDVDTSLYLFHNYNPLLKNTITANYLGNMGSPAQSNIYYERRKNETGFIFSEPYGIYFHLPKNQKYYNTKRQYTLLSYSNAGPKDESEQLLSVIHTQNVTENFNVGVDYDMISSDGRYSNQQIRQNNLTLFSSFKHKAYKVHTNYNLNRVKAQENGGVDSLWYLGADEYKKRRNIPIKLEGAGSHVLSTNFYLAQEYEFGKKRKEVIITERKESVIESPDRKAGKIGEKSKKETLGNDSEDNKLMNQLNAQSDSLFSADSIKIYYDTTYVEVLELSGFSISHELIYNKDVRKYFDETLIDSFYNERNIFIDSTETSDSVKQWQFGNKFSIYYRNADNFSARLSFYTEQMTYKSNIKLDTINYLPDTIRNCRAHHNNSNLSIYLNAKLFNKLLFSGYGEYYIKGYKKENTKVNLKFGYIVGRNNEISLKGNYFNKYPDQFYKKFTSNHFDWENDDLRRIKEWDVGLYYKNNKYKVFVDIKYGQISNYLYLDHTANVNQYNSQINILSGEVYKSIKFGPINSVTRFVYQKTTNDSILNLPEYSLYQSLFFEKLTKFKATGGKLLWQFGVDYRFSSAYMADAYMPISGLFYRQYENEQENYHRFDVYANLTISRARFYIKYHYINSAINEKYYFTAPFYPSPEPVLV